MAAFSLAGKAKKMVHVCEKSREKAMENKAFQLFIQEHNILYYYNIITMFYIMLIFPIKLYYQYC